MCGAKPPLPHTSSWHGVQLSTGYVFIAMYLGKHRGNFTYNNTK